MRLTAACYAFGESLTPGTTNDYVAYDILWGAQNHPQLPVYYEPNGGHSQTPHGAAAKDNQNVEAFLWNHFFGGDSLLKPPTSSHEVDQNKLSVSVRFDEGPQPISGRMWWIYDLRQVPPRSCTCRSPKTNGWIWNATQKPAHGLQRCR